MNDFTVVTEDTPVANLVLEAVQHAVKAGWTKDQLEKEFGVAWMIANAETLAGE